MWETSMMPLRVAIPNNAMKPMIDATLSRPDVLHGSARRRTLSPDEP